METQSYKRTIAGSVGAGMGAIFNGSGRTYFMLEHKTSSKYHQVGEVQKIIVDQIELGRNATCQVRFDESCETVSRSHAAIVRDGENWKLVHLSHSNPTLVNGRPVQGTYYLQNGDEIQLSVNGPRMGFIVPQGRQALTSSIGLTERMNLFRQQALRPYRRAIWGLCALVLILAVGLGTWNYQLSLDNKELLAKVNDTQDEQALLISQMENLLNEKDSLTKLMNQVPKKETKVIYQRLEKINDGINQNFKKIVDNKNETDKLIDRINNNVSDNDNDDDTTDEAAKEQADVAKEHAKVVKKQEEVDDKIVELEKRMQGAATDISAYYPFIYSLKITSIKVEKDGISIDPHIATSDIICGNGFLLDNGTFVTARQNIEPWIYSGVLEGEWRRILAEYIGVGCKVIIDYDAYSTSGTAAKLSFSNTDFAVDPSGDVETIDIEVRKEIRTWTKNNGIEVDWVKRHYVKTSVFTAKSKCFAILQGKGKAGQGIPFDAVKSVSLAGGQEVQIAGYRGNPDVHNLSDYVSYFKTNTSRKDADNGTITLQQANSNIGYLGSPAFIKEEDGNFVLVGMEVGQLFGEGRLVPADSFY